AEKRPVLPWDQFSEWLHCVCVVTFDLELGQAMEFLYPNHIELSDVERTNICYLAFPDSNSGCMGDTQYWFRIRRSALYKTTDTDVDYQCSKDCPVTLLKDKTHFYGYVYFRQVRDKTLKRGYFQKSVVLLSSLPYFNFFKDIVDIIAPEYFDNGEPCLEAACHDIDQWPSPIPGQILNLPLMGLLLHVRIPTKQDKPGTNVLEITDKNSDPGAFSLSSIHEVNLYESLCDVLPHIHLLWELVLIGAPIVVMAPSPTVCSSTVLALVSSISPLRYCSDYRPYFTIHDSEFKEYTTKTQAPYLCFIPVDVKTWRVRGAGEFPWTHLNIAPPSTKLKMASKIKTFDPKSGIYSKYKQFLKKDKNFIKGLTKDFSGKCQFQAQSALLRRHFLELTQSFIIPLERYLASLMPLQKCISPLKAPPTLKPFRPNDFIQTLDSNGPQLTSGTKGDWIGLYRRFMQSANFEHWLCRRKLEMEKKLVSLHMAALSETDLMSWCQQKSEVEIVDMVLRIREKINLVRSHKLDVSTETVELLADKLTGITNTLPADLQGILSK
uniref:UDENN domain-containing protein n=1 Tax=Ciona savignyi TaxID=51511 RepID=H2YY45_CIOSA